MTYTNTFADARRGASSERPRRVAMVTNWLSRRGAGVAGAVEALSRTVNSADDMELKVFGLFDEQWSTVDQALWRGAPACTLHVVGPSKFSYAPRMLQELTKWAPDLVHLHGIWTYPSFAVRQWASATKRPYIVSPHGMLAPAALDISKLNKKLASFLYQRDVLRGARLLHATSGAEGNEIRTFGLDQPIVLFPNGIDLPDESQLVKTASSMNVVSLGRIHPIKSLDVLIRAWANLEAQFRNWRLDIVGPNENDHAAELARLVTQLGLQRVTIGGPAYGADKITLLSKAQLFVLSSRSENFALTVAESLACETPVISTKGAPWSGLETHKCGWWIDHGVEPLAAALKTAMSMSLETRREMGVRGRAWMGRCFSWSSVAAQALDMYRSVAP